MGQPGGGGVGQPGGGVGQPGGRGGSATGGRGGSATGGGVGQPGGKGWVSQGGRGGSAKIEQHREYLLHGGRYASCVHAGGLSCFRHGYGNVTKDGQ